MKPNPILLSISTAVAALLAYANFSIAPAGQALLLSIGSFILLSVTLGIAMGTSFEAARSGVSIKIVAFGFFFLSLVTNLIFAFTGYSNPVFIITNGLEFLLFTTISYLIFKTNQ